MHEVFSVLFGVGTGLTLDEFALWLNLKDVYWSEQGRRSIDAVIVMATFAGIVLIGLKAGLDVAKGVEDAVVSVVGSFGFITILLVIVNFTKEKFVTGVVGLFLPPVALVGAVAARQGALAVVEVVLQRREEGEGEAPDGEGGSAVRAPVGAPTPPWRSVARGLGLNGRLRLNGLSVGRVRVLALVGARLVDQHADRGGDRDREQGPEDSQ